MGGQPIIRVSYELLAGKHFFTAATEFGRGLCVAHSDLKTAFEEVGKQLKVILSENHGLKFTGGLEDPAAWEDIQGFLNATASQSERSQPKTFKVDWRAWKLGSPDL